MDYSKYIQAAATTQTEPKKQESVGSGDYELPAAGPALARLVAYIEVGKHEVPDKYKGGTKVIDRVKQVFELFGPKHKPGTRVTVSETLSTYHKSNYYKKLFNPMRGGDESIKHPAQLLGRPFKVNVFHKKLANGRTIATLQDDTEERNYHITLPIVEDPLTGETRELAVPPPTSTLMCFLWGQADRIMWDSIEIKDGYNVFQNDIKKALNYKGSHIEKFVEIQNSLSAHDEPTQTLVSAPSVEYTETSDDPFGADFFEEPPQAQPAPGARHFTPGKFRRG